MLAARRALGLARQVSAREASSFSLPRFTFSPTALADGNYAEASIMKKGNLMGTDQFGNQYFENMSYQAGRHRWVVFADKRNYDASAIPREWHGWIHMIHDATPTTTQLYHPVYEEPASENKSTGNAAISTSLTPGCHFPKGHAKNPNGRKNWKRYEAWVPPS